MRRQATVQRTEARRQHINRERARVVGLQYTVYILRQQEQRQEPPLEQMQHQSNINPPPPPLPYNQIPHHHPPPPPYNQFPQQPPPSPHHDTTDPKSPLANHLQLASWPLHYRAASLPKYHGNINPHKFLMCYKAAITSAGGDDATLTKSLIIYVGVFLHR
jgi:hypothetical protein